MAQDRILLTFDKDFGDLAFRAGLRAPSGIILFRIPPDSASYLTRVVVAAIESRTDWSGHFAVVDPARIRLTPLP